MPYSLAWFFTFIFISQEVLDSALGARFADTQAALELPVISTYWAFLFIPFRNFTSRLRRRLVLLQSS
jgi:hypothetical protein